jgi:hypothetical protein
MSRPTRTPNTQTPQDRKLWKKIKAAEAAHIREKRKRYDLPSNREARLYCAPPQRPQIAIARSKIIPFPPTTRDHHGQR